VAGHHHTILDYQVTLSGIKQWIVFSRSVISPISIAQNSMFFNYWMKNFSMYNFSALVSMYFNYNTAPFFTKHLKTVVAHF